MQLVGRKRELCDLVNDYIIKFNETEVLLLWFILCAYDGVELRNDGVNLKVAKMREELEKICGIELSNS